MSALIYLKEKAQMTLSDVMKVLYSLHHGVNIINHISLTIIRIEIFTVWFEFILQ